MKSGAGLGLENKWNEVFFLVCLLAGLLMTKQRRVLASKWFPLAVALMLLLILPNLLWEVHRHWPTLELLHNDQINGKNVHMGPLLFVLNQIVDWGPMMAPLWIGGVLWLLFSRAAKTFRFLGVTYVLYLPLMMFMHAKHYYLVAIYPLYFAAGAAAWDVLFQSRWRRHGLTPAYVSLHVLATAAMLPVIIPVLSPASTLAYQERLHMHPPKMETGTTAPLPQYIADRCHGQATYSVSAVNDRRTTPLKRALLQQNAGQDRSVSVYAKSPYRSSRGCRSIEKRFLALGVNYRQSGMLRSESAKLPYGRQHAQNPVNERIGLNVSIESRKTRAVSLFAEGPVPRFAEQVAPSPRFVRSMGWCKPGSPQWDCGIPPVHTKINAIVQP